MFSVVRAKINTDLEKFTGAGIILAQNIMRENISLAKTDVKL